jgi:hypothetical protein
MSSEVIHLESPQSSVEGFKLPSGYLDDEGVVHDQIVMSEITGEEEDILASRKMLIHKRLQAVLERCTVSLGDVPKGDIGKALKKLPVVDRLYMLIKLRAISLGNMYTFKTACPQEACKMESRMTVDLDELVATGLKDPKKRHFEVVLPKSKKKVRWAVMDGSGEDKLSGMQQSKDSASLMILGRVLEIGTEPPSLDKIKSLPMADRDFLRGQFQEQEGSLDDKIEIDCPFCGEHYETDIDIGQPSFFFPAGSSKR